jgi:endonuclease/exonuclease/phosphatase family metal-dependent hydrolase
MREFATENNLKITNTFYRKKDINKYTWSARGLKSLIDYITVNKKLVSQIRDTTVCRGVDINSDHYLIKSEIELMARWKRIKNNGKKEERRSL